MAESIAAALERIAAIVGQRGILTGADAAPLLRDERGLYQGAAALVVRPASTAECAAVVRVCHDARIGVVPQGGNTGYCGGATPFDGEPRQILLSLARLNRVLVVDTVGFTMTAEAGVVLARAHAAAREHGLLFPLSMGSEGSAQIGGNLATNAGGLAVLRYGTMRDLVLGLQVVLANGEVVSELKGLRKDNTGYDSKALFLGAEGTLGVITAAVLKLFPEPRARATAWAAVASVDAACRLLGRARRESGDQVVSAEYVSQRSLDLVLGHVDGARDPLGSPAVHYVLLELASADTDDALRAKLERVLATGLAAGEIVDGTIAESEAQRRALWLLRERVPEAERRAGGSVKHDVSVRIGRIPEFLARAEPALARIAPHRLSIYGHIGDGNLHFNVLPPAGQSIDAFRAGLRIQCCRPHRAGSSPAQIGCPRCAKRQRGIGQ
jgi:FAD/FMN-containing dehydrogenase